MFVAMPSPDCSNSLNVRNPRTIRSRMINNDQRSPKISRETLTGHPDRRLGLGFSATRERLTKSLEKCNPIFRHVRHVSGGNAVVWRGAASGALRFVGSRASHG